MHLIVPNGIIGLTAHNLHTEFQGPTMYLNCFPFTMQHIMLARFI